MIRRRTILVAGSLYAMAGAGGAASLSGQRPSAERIRALTADHVQEAFDTYRRLLSFPNDAHYPDDILRQLEWLEEAFGSRGFQTDRLATGGTP